MRRCEFITLVVLSGEEKKAWAAGCDDYVPNPSVHHNCWRKFAFPGNSGGVDCCGARVCLCRTMSEKRTRTDININTRQGLTAAFGERVQR